MQRLDLTSQEMIDRATALRPLLREQSADTEQRTYPSDEIHQACVDAGFYRLYVPRRYGGYEFGAPTFMRVVQELSRGDISTGWCIALAAAHALQVASWWPEQAQDEIFGDGDFRCAAVAAPIGPAVRSGTGWELTGKVGYASGIPLSTHYMGQALIAGDDGRPTERMLLFVAPRSEFAILDDWGRLMGLKGSASNTITFDRGRIPAHWAIEDALMVDFDVAARGTPGVELHGNPMYGGRAMACFTLTLTAVAIGGAYAALDEYEEMMHSRLTPLPPMVPRIGDETFHRWFGSALAKIATAEAAMYNAVDQHMAACRHAAEDGIPYTYGEDMRIGCIGREGIVQAWEIFQSEIFRTAGSSAAVDGSRFERIYRDMSMLNSHRNTVLRDWAFGELAREHLGLPRQGRGNVQTPHGTLAPAGADGRRRPDHMTERPPSYRVLAVHYAQRQTTFSDAYYRWSAYGEPDGSLTVSYYFWILEPLHAPGSPPIVLDCGFEPARGERMGRRCLCRPADALARLGIDPAAVGLLVISHIHWDHVGNLDLFPNARMPVARAELEFWTADPVAQRPQFAAHADPDGIEQLRRAASEERVELIEDRADVAPGITAVRVGGHAPGQLVFEVAGEHGPIVLASDAIHYDAELELERPFGIFSDLADMYRGYTALKRHASAGAAVVPGHDPSVMRKFAPLDGDAAGLAVCLTDSRSDR